jgi:hypothetical protein
MHGNTMKNEEAPKPPKAAYVPPTLQKRQRIEQVLGFDPATTHGDI